MHQTHLHYQSALAASEDEPRTPVLYYNDLIHRSISRYHIELQKLLQFWHVFPITIFSTLTAISAIFATSVVGSEQ